MSTTPPPDYLTPYRNAVQEHGPGFKATLWGSKKAQELRFAVFANLVPLEGCSVLDVGCGDGDLALWLHQQHIGLASYIGIDAMPEMVQAASERQLANATFEAADLVADPDAFARYTFDYAFFSGTLNTMDDETARRLIVGAWKNAAQGVVFNFLSDRCHSRWKDRDLTPARRFDTAAWLDWAMSQTSRVSFSQEYLDGHDATIVMRHDEAD